MSGARDAVVLGLVARCDGGTGARFGVDWTSAGPFQGTGGAHRP